VVTSAHQSARQRRCCAVEEFLEGAEKGEIRKRGGELYKPAYLRQVRSAIYKHVPVDILDRRGATGLSAAVAVSPNARSAPVLPVRSSCASRYGFRVAIARQTPIGLEG
jgi:hypothetical protein